MKRSIKIFNTLLIAMVFSTSLFAQDGEGLFKAKCSTCHQPDKDGTGPKLQGVKQKWADAGEAELLVEWVKNSTALIASGKSKLAGELKGYSAMDMPAQEVSAADVDAILTYVDNFKAAPTTPPPGDNVATDPAEKEVVYVPNYKSNLKLFYWLIASIVVLLIGIIIMANSILNLTKSEFFKQRLAKQSEKQNDEDGGHKNIVITILALIGMFGFMALNNTSLALSVNALGEATEPAPWLIVENSDLYLLIAVDIILVCIIFYLKSMFKNLMNMIRTEQEKVVAAPKRLKKINQVLTDVVPIEEEHTILMHHEYDGIRELDNNLPPWWVWGFVLTIIFSVVYLVNYHVLKTGDLQYVAYEKEMKKADKDVKEYLSKMAMNVDETNVTLLTDESALSSGKALFDANCVSCHNAKGQGGIGPNLTDKNWIYGYDIKEVFGTIKNGTSKGMPEHNSKFNPVQIQQVASFVLSLPATPGNDPMGDIVEK